MGLPSNFERIVTGAAVFGSSVLIEQLEDAGYVKADGIPNPEFEQMVKTMLRKTMVEMRRTYIHVEEK